MSKHFAVGCRWLSFMAFNTNDYIGIFKGDTLQGKNYFGYLPSAVGALIQTILPALRGFIRHQLFQHTEISL